MPEYAKDAIIAVLGASVALAGLLLIFSGFLFAQASAFPPATTDDKIINKFKNVGRFGLVPVFLSMVLAGISAIWFLHPSPCIYFVSVIGFLFVLAGSAAYAIIVLAIYLR